MILYVINDADKIFFNQSQIVRPFKWLVCLVRLVCEQHITSGHSTWSGILLGVRYSAISQHDPAIVLSCYQGIYKCILINALPAHDYVFYSPWESFIHGPFSKALLLFVIRPH